MTKNNIIKTRNQTVLQLFLDTGLRVSELSSINISDINFDKKEIKVLGKGNKERIVMFSDDTSKLITKYLRYRGINIKGGKKFLYNSTSTRTFNCLPVR